MAESLANFYLPADAHPQDTPVEDPTPALTEKLRGLIAGLADHKVDETLFGDEAQKEVVPALKGFGPVIVGQLDPLTKMYLIERKVGGTGMRLVYRTMFGIRPMKWTFVFDREGKIEDVEPGTAD